MVKVDDTATSVERSLRKRSTLQLCVPLPTFFHSHKVNLTCRKPITFT